MSKINYKLIEGEPVCTDLCEHRVVSPGMEACELIYGRTEVGKSCVPGLREQRDNLKAENKQLRKCLSEQKTVMGRYKEIRGLTAQDRREIFDYAMKCSKEMIEGRDTVEDE